ncbi:hypothetical protein OIT44_07345 [Weissella ceti]|uniref:DNA-directed RNA polymerase beta subunit n=1 Tax=Weissella ceti TaxID=759620 RepID=A0ABT3E7F5_9LACO|nr:hypothetical protein [Weissella ceti]MCW0953863.1 hypothetical protein [Weissella ceti]QVK12597.1 hypothetical protein KHQ31_02950 [Weissella ceti]
MMNSTLSEDDIRLFFKQDYHDQGMAKWQGFRLSEHTEAVSQYMASEKEQQNAQYRPEMTPLEISQILAKAWQKKLFIQIQLSAQTTEGQIKPIQAGKIQGFTDDDTLVLNQQEIPINSIRWCALIEKSQTI